MAKISRNHAGVWFYIFVFLLLVFPLQAVDWQGEYNRLKAKIEREEDQPTSGGWASKQVEEYVRWLGIKAQDRNNANGLAAQAQAAGNPYWEKQFMDLQEMAQQSGDLTLWKGCQILMKARSKSSGMAGDSWIDAVFKAGPAIGERLFQAAVTNGFDKEIVRDAAACLMRFANNDLDHGTYGLYLGRERMGPATGNFNVDCEPLSFFNQMEKEGEPLQPADRGMGWVQQVRDICTFYSLGAEYDEATEMMEQYLQHKQVLCVLPEGRGHSFYLALAEQYKLPKAKAHIGGFYAFVLGKVEVDRGEGPRPARGATVKVTDPHDQKMWSATAGSGGSYEMKKVILHKKCSPFHIVAEFEGEKKEEDFEGPLDEPDPAHRFEKNFLFKKPPPRCGHGTFQKTETQERHFGPNKYVKGMETRHGQVTFDTYSRGKFTGTMTIHYTNHFVDEDDLYIKTYHDEGTATVPCSLNYSWGDKACRYSFGSKDFEVQRTTEIVHKPFEGRGQWTETKESTEVRSQTGSIHSGTKNKPPRWALNLVGSEHENEPEHTLDFTWSFNLCKPESK